MNKKRPPIVVVVGHIDHGKSTLLHSIREAKSVKKERGDITQHIGAYEIVTTHENKDRKLTMIDTPGHNAFSHIKEHGVDIADMALLIVSSEEGFKNQTKEAYKIIKEAKIPFIVVFTKIDIGFNNLEKAKQSLLENEIYLEGLGGDIPYIDVSSTTGKNIDELIELIFLTTDLYEITEDENKHLGILIESDVDEKSGVAGTIILKNGSIKKGDCVVIDDAFAPVRIMKDDLDNSIEEAHPSKPIRIIGFNKLPNIGSEVVVYKDKKDAMGAIEKFSEINRKNRKEIKKDSFVINVVAKADTGGGLFSLIKFLEEQAPEKIHFQFVNTGIGNITESDIQFTKNSNSKINVIGFHNKIDPIAKRQADQNKIDVFLFDTIYDLSKWLDNLLKEGVKEKNKIDNIGKGKVIKIFAENESRKEYVSGIEIIDGKFYVGQKVLITRKNLEIGEYVIKNIEQRNVKKDEVDGTKTQFASLLTGDKKILLGDEILGYE